MARTTKVERQLRCRLEVEALEQRAVPAVTATWDATTKEVTVTGDDTLNEIVVDTFAEKIRYPFKKASPLCDRRRGIGSQRLVVIGVRTNHTHLSWRWPEASHLQLKTRKMERRCLICSGKASRRSR
jgi:hypothetical protein